LCCEEAITGCRHLLSIPALSQHKDAPTMGSGQQQRLPVKLRAKKTPDFVWGGGSSGSKSGPLGRGPDICQHLTQHRSIEVRLSVRGFVPEDLRRGGGRAARGGGTGARRRARGRRGRCRRGAARSGRRGGGCRAARRCRGIFLLVASAERDSQHRGNNQGFAHHYLNSCR